MAGLLDIIKRVADVTGPLWDRCRRRSFGGEFGAGASAKNSSAIHNPVSVRTSSKPAPPPPTVTITVPPAGFDPPAVTTTLEGNIIWTQGDAKAHVIASGDPGKPDGKFESGPLAKGSSFTLVLHTAGTYHY